VQKVFSTADVKARDRFDYWHEVACKNIVLHDSSPANRNMFCGELNAAQFGDVRLVLFENSPMSIVHDKDHARLADGDEIFVCRQMAGALQLEQVNRELVLRPGDLTFLDPTLPYRGRFFAGSRLLVVKVPRRTLDGRDVPLRDLWCSPITRIDPQHRLTSEFLGILPNHADNLGSSAQTMVRNHVLDMLAMSSANVRRRHAPGTEQMQGAAAKSLSPRERTVLQLILEGRAGKEIAYALGISERTVQSHRSRIMLKMGVRNVVELVQAALNAGV
jgi:DNA-binding CsgD family transcriptional regulator